MPESTKSACQILNTIEESRTQIQVLLKKLRACPDVDQQQLRYAEEDIYRFRGRLMNLETPSIRRICDFWKPVS